jgi:hypothetical protein
VRPGEAVQHAEQDGLRVHPPGSYLVVSHACSDPRPAVLSAFETPYMSKVAAQGRPRTRADITRFFDGFALIDRPATGSAAATMRFACCAVDCSIGGPGKRFDGFAESWHSGALLRTSSSCTGFTWRLREAIDHRRQSNAWHSTIRRMRSVNI